MIGSFNNATCTIPSSGSGLNSSAVSGSAGLNFSLTPADGKASLSSNNSYAITISGANGGGGGGVGVRLINQRVFINRILVFIRR